MDTINIIEKKKIVLWATTLCTFTGPKNLVPTFHSDARAEHPVHTCGHSTRTQYALDGTCIHILAGHPLVCGFVLFAAIADATPPPPRAEIWPSRIRSTGELPLLPPPIRSCAPGQNKCVMIIIIIIRTNSYDFFFLVFVFTLFYRRARFLFFILLGIFFPPSFRPRLPVRRCRQCRTARVGPATNYYQALSTLVVCIVICFIVGYLHRKNRIKKKKK